MEPVKYNGEPGTVYRAYRYVTTYHLLLTTYYLLLTAYCSLLTPHAEKCGGSAHVSVEASLRSHL